MKLKAYRVCGKRPARQSRPLNPALAVFDLLLASPALVVNAVSVSVRRMRTNDLVQRLQIVHRELSLNTRRLAGGIFITSDRRPRAQSV